MPNLISFGCSYTYGHGLPDCVGDNYLQPGKSPSNLTFAAIIAKKIGYNFFNLGECGSSNKKILYKILNSELQKTDLIVIHWSHFDRHCLIKENQNIIDINPWTNTKQNNTYYKFIHDDFDAAFNTFTYIDYINFKFKNKIKVLNLPPIISNNIDLQKFYNKFLDTDILITKYNIHDCKIDYALDRSHPGVHSHKLLAEKILEDYNYIF